MSTAITPLSPSPSLHPKPTTAQEQDEGILQDEIAKVH